MAGLAIVSIKNPAVKELRRLRVGRSRARHRRGLALVRGRQLIQSIGEFFKFKQVYTHEPRESFGRYNAEQVVRVEKAVLKHILFSQSYEAEAHSGRLDDDEFVVGTIEQPPEADFDVQVPRRLLVLDGVKHPENMGMLLSTAVALRYDGAFLCGGCVDPFNYKVLEASQAVAWTLPYRIGDPEELLAICRKHRLAPCAGQIAGAGFEAVPLADLPELDAKRHAGFCLAVGSESKGVSPALLAKCRRVALPMSELMESLNAGVAGGILMHALACAWGSQ